jgi:hypothetical protein
MRPPFEKTRSQIQAGAAFEHREGATEIGKLTAEAVVGEYETAAREIEGMGAQLIDCIKRCEAMTRDAFLVIEEIKGELYADDGRGAQDLHRIQGKDHRPPAMTT